MPFIVRWTGTIPAGKVDTTTVCCGIDLFPTLCELAGADFPEAMEPDGEDISSSFFGDSTERKRPIFWYYPNNPEPGNKEYISPELAVREGDWKLLINPDGSEAQLYNLENDRSEENNKLTEKTLTADELWKKIRSWAAEVGIETKDVKPQAPEQ
jgi:arylsulfatase A-like enzyme